MKYERGSFITVPSREMLRGIHPTAQTLYMWLCGYANETGTCFPSRKTLADDVGCSERTIDQMVDILRERELLKVNPRMDGDKQLSNLYTVLVVPPLAESATPPSKSCPTPLAESAHELNPLELKEPVAIAPDILEVRESDADAPSKTPKDDYVAEYKAMCDWSIKRRGFGFTASTKQYAALKKARKLGIGPNKLKERWVELEGEEWRDGFDWTSVVSSFDKRA